MKNIVKSRQRKYICTSKDWISKEHDYAGFVQQRIPADFGAKSGRIKDNNK